MSAKTTKKVSNISPKPAKRDAAKERQKQPPGRVSPNGKVLSKTSSKSKPPAKSGSATANIKAIQSGKPGAQPGKNKVGGALPSQKVKAQLQPGKSAGGKGSGNPKKSPPVKTTAGKSQSSAAVKAPTVKKPGKAPVPPKKALPPKPLPAGKATGTGSKAPQSDKKGPKEVDKKALAKAKEAEKKALAKRRDAEKKALAKAKEAEKKAKEAERKKRDFEKKEREKEAAKLAQAKQQEAERKKREAEKQKQALELQKKREAEQKAREAEKARLLAEKEAAKEVARLAAEAEKQRKLQEKEEARLAKEQERLQLKAQRDAEREEARRLKEEEKAKRDAEREAYRKAKEAEREKIRAAKEAARRALEGRIAEATRNANKLGGGRSTSTRFYSPKAIPDQSGTTRRLQGTIAMMGVAPTAAANIVAPTGGSEPPVNTPVIATPPPTSTISDIPEGETPAQESPESSDVVSEGSSPPGVLQTPPPGTPTPGAPTVEGAPLVPGSDEEAAHAVAAERAHQAAENAEERYRAIEERLKHVPESFRRDYQETIDMSWIHHDSALEGVVYTFQELKAAIDPSSNVITDSSMQPVIDEIRRHKAAIELVRDLGERKRAPITVDTIKKIYVTLHPEEGDVKTVKYRRDIPQHRLYFHEYAHPEKIQQKVRQVIDWLNGPEPKKLKSPIRVAARVHYELLRAFPFQNDSGKVARLVMNLILIRHGHPPALIHSTERQRYYEALKGALPVLVQMVTESILNALSSIEKLLDEQEVKLRS
jgi:chemotaxis protein histidine kinase CheA